jgi:hypothetical protein
MFSGRALIAGAIVASLALIITSLALGGSSYEPKQVSDPCKPRAWRHPDSISEDAEQFSLSALDGAACKLGVSRETLALALAKPGSLDEFGQNYGIGDAELEAAIRAGLNRAIDDAEQAGELDSFVAAGLHELVAQIPVEDAIKLINDAQEIFSNAQGLLGQFGGLLPDVLKQQLPPEVQGLLGGGP